MASPFESSRYGLDRFGIWLSGLCAVHCLASIVAITVLGLGAGVLFDPSIHRVGLAIAVGIGAATLGLGVLRHGDTRPLLAGAIGLSLMTIGLLVDHGVREAVFTISGVTIVALAHLTNLRRLTR